jgi:hypothetical protein
MNPSDLKDADQMLAYIDGVFERVVKRLQTDQRQNTNLVGQILTSGCDLHSQRTATYCRQLDFLLLEKKAFSREGRTIDAAEFFNSHLGGLSFWLEPLINAILRGSRPEIPPRLFSIFHPDANELTHQAKILYHLCSPQPRAPHLFCFLPQGSGRTTSAFLAALHTLTTRMGSILYIAPTPRAARLIARRADAFLSETGWGNAITLALLIEKSQDDPLANRLQHVVWNDPQQERINCRERPEIFNIIVTVPELLEQLILQQHRYYKEFLADLQLIILDSADRYYGTYGSHVSLILRRLRRLLDRYGASYRTFTTIAPHLNAPNHVRRLFGFDDDRFQVVSEIAEVMASEDAAPWPERMAATWTPPLRFRELGGLGPDPAIPIIALKTRPQRLSSRDGLMGLLSSLAHALSRESQGQGKPAQTDGKKGLATKILVLAREDNLTEDDLRNWTTSGYRAELVHSMNELDADHLDCRAIVIFGHLGGWPSFIHQIAHFGDKESLMVLAAGSDALSRSLVRKAESDLQLFKAGAREFFEALRKDANNHSQQAAQVLSFSPELLEISPDNQEILKLHLYLAASIEGGLTKSEAERFFGTKALPVLESLKGEFRGFRREQVGSGGDPTHHYYIDADPESGPQWDPLCVKWDRPGHQKNLIPIVVSLQGGPRPVSYLEKPLLPSFFARGQTRDQSGTFVRARRRLLVTSIYPNRVDAEYGQNLEYRPRLSRILIDPEASEEKTLIIKNRDPQKENDRGLDLKMTLGLSRVHIREFLVGRIQADGYATDDLNIIKFGPDQPACEFKTSGLLIRFDDQLESDFEFIHSMTHLIKIVLPLYLRYDPEELEIRVCPQIPNDKQKSTPSWHILIYDNHPDGDCYARALARYPAEWWKRLFESAYDILRGCPCVVGCWQCLKVFECREPHETPSRAGEPAAIVNNQDIDKEKAFTFLGKRFDNDYDAYWALKSGGKPTTLMYEQYENTFAYPQVRNLADRVIKVLRDKCTFEITSDRRALFYFNPDISTPGVYLSGSNQLYVWPPSKGLKEQDYIFLLAHEYTHNWQFTSNRFHPRLRYYNFDNAADPNNIPFRGRLFLEGCARWAEVQVCDHFGLDAHMIEIRNDPQFSEYELGYKLFLFLEYHCDFARLVDFLQTAEILVRLPSDQGWQLVRTAEDYVRYLYDDGRLAILGPMASPLGPRSRCLEAVPAYAAPGGENEMLRKLSKATYLAVSQRSDCHVQDDGNSHPDISAFLNSLKGTLALSFDPEEPILKILDSLDRETKQELKFHCLDCPRSGKRESAEKKKGEKASLEGPEEKSPVCSVFDACHLHSSGDQGRSTTDLLRKINEALNKIPK